MAQQQRPVPAGPCSTAARRLTRVVRMAERPMSRSTARMAADRLTGRWAARMAAAGRVSREARMAAAGLMQVAALAAPARMVAAGSMAAAPAATTADVGAGRNARPNVVTGLQMAGAT
jgi:hypothetical protein